MFASFHVISTIYALFKKVPRKVPHTQKYVISN